MKFALQRFELSAAVRRRARTTAFELGEKLLHAAKRAGPNDEQWTPMRSFTGTSGYALAFLALAQATGEPRFEAAMHEFIRKAASLQDTPALGLFDGVSGLRATAALATSIEPRYNKLVEQCEAYIRVRTPIAPVSPASFSAFDVICGWSGIRLARCVDGTREHDRLVDHLAWTIADASRWRCVHPVRGGRAENDLGMAHGVAGMIAALSLTVDHLEGLGDILGSAAYFLADLAVERHGALAWPYAAQCDPESKHRAAWCYGALGICAALHSAAQCLQDSKLQSFAVRSLERVGGTATREWLISEPSLCHGTMGAALVFASVGTAGASPVLQGVAERLVTETLEDVDAHAGRCLAYREDGLLHDEFGQLNGSAGVLTALLTLTGDCDASWMRCYGLAPIS